MTKATYNSPTAYYGFVDSSGNYIDYYIGNDAWNVGSLVEGAGYSASFTMDQANFQSGVLFNWTYPTNVGGVYAYPHIGYDVAYVPVATTQVGNNATLSVNYSASLSNTANSTLAFDLWFNSSPNGSFATTTDELLIEVHSTSAGTPNQPFNITDSTLTGATVYIASASGAGATWKFIDVKTVGDIMSGTLSLSDIFKTLIWDGALTGQEYLTSIQFGSEVHGGSGSLQINNLSTSWTEHPSLVGTSGNDTFTITNIGGNNVVGNGGVDTVVYAGSYSSYQIKSSGSETLVTEGNNISSLDELRGITSIKFSDGTYNVATATFTSNATSTATTISSLLASGTGVTNGTGDLNAGHVITLTMKLSGVVTVTGGTPTLTLNDGGTATYTGGSGSSALTFSYKVAAGQNTPNLVVTAINLNSAAVTDGAGNLANLSLAGLSNTGPQIDTTAPAAPVISSDSTASGTAVTLTGTAEASSTVTIYEGSTNLGTVTANSTGAWNFTTGQLSPGTYVFAATATDTAANVSAMSLPIDPTIDTTTSTSAVSVDNTTMTLAVSSANVILSGSNDSVTFTGNANTIQISGSSENVTITGTGGNSLTLGPGADIVTLGHGSNSVTGGTAADSDATVVLGGGTDTVIFTTGNNTIDATIGRGGTLLTTDSLTGAGSDTLVLAGSKGSINLNNLASFSGFSEIVVSGSGDTLTLTDANLTVARVSGNKDKIYLGTGIDTVAYTNINQSTHSGPDSISGFNSSYDTIDFSAIAGLNSNNQNVTINILTSTPTTISGHTIDVVTFNGNTVIYANANGSNETIGNIHGHSSLPVDMQINLVGTTALNSSDFILHH